MLKHLDKFKSLIYFCEISSEIVENSVNLNFMGGSFAISYNSIDQAYNLFQDSIRRLLVKSPWHARNFD